MPLESAQMLCTIARELRYEEAYMYKSVHLNHPCTRWAAANAANWAWLCKHGLALCQEYTKRYGREHKCKDIIRMIYRYRMGPKGIIPLTPRSPFVQAMPDKYKQKDPVKAYRAYYLGEKKRFAKWTHRKPPSWWKIQYDKGGNPKL